MIDFVVLVLIVKEVANTFLVVALGQQLQRIIAVNLVIGILGIS